MLAPDMALCVCQNALDWLRLKKKRVARSLAGRNSMSYRDSAGNVRGATHCLRIVAESIIHLIALAAKKKKKTTKTINAIREFVMHTDESTEAYGYRTINNKLQ